MVTLLTLLTPFTLLTILYKSIKSIAESTVMTRDKPLYHKALRG